MDRTLDHTVNVDSAATGLNAKFYFNLEPTYRVINVKYYTVLNAFSYAGGLFNSVLALFFFLRWYGVTLIEF